MHCYCVTEHGAPLERVERPLPRPTGTEVLIQVNAAGLCHTDLHLWEGYYDLGGGRKLLLLKVHDGEFALLFLIRLSTRRGHTVRHPRLRQLVKITGSLPQTEKLFP